MLNFLLVLKKNTCSFCIICMCLMTMQDINAQTIEITPSYGYQFGSRLNYGRNNYLKVSDGDQFGLTIGYETFDDTMIELSYTHQGTSVNIKDEFITGSFNEERLADLAGDWIMVGGTKYFPNGNIRPFAGGALGMVILSPSNENRDLINVSYRNETKFAFSFKAGVNIMLSEHIGINLQGNLMFPVNWGGFYFGTGGGGAAVSSTTVIGGVSGGLVFRI